MRGVCSSVRRRVSAVGWSQPYLQSLAMAAPAPVAVGPIAQCRPLLGRHFVELGGRDRPACDAHTLVEDGALRRRREGKDHLEQRAVGAPVDRGVDGDVVAGRAGGEGDRLHEARALRHRARLSGRRAPGRCRRSSSGADRRSACGPGARCPPSGSPRRGSDRRSCPGSPARPARRGARVASRLSKMRAMSPCASISTRRRSFSRKPSPTESSDSAGAVGASDVRTS